MLTHTEIREAGVYYCRRNDMEFTCQFSGYYPCFDFSVHGWGPSATPHMFTDFEPIPTREQWAAASELQNDINNGSGTPLPGTRGAA